MSYIQDIPYSKAYVVDEKNFMVAHSTVDSVDLEQKQYHHNVNMKLRRKGWGKRAKGFFARYFPLAKIVHKHAFDNSRIQISLDTKTGSLVVRSHWSDYVEKTRDTIHI